MDRAVIVGAFEFVGFHLCKKFLEMGFEVTGIQLDSEKGDPYLEEKKFEIGRNANFMEKTLEEWKTQTERGESQTFTVFSLYDLFMEYKDEMINNDHFIKSLLKQMDHQGMIIFLLPIQLIIKEYESENLRAMEDFLNKNVVKNNLKNAQFYFLPSLYGPWQPETFLFQKAILNHLNDEAKESREYMEDAIFIYDAIEELIGQINKKISGKFLLVSGKEHHFKECADFLQITNYFRKEVSTSPFNVDETIQILPIQIMTSITDSLTIQQEHMNHLFPFNKG